MARQRADDGGQDPGQGDPHASLPQDRGEQDVGALPVLGDESGGVGGQGRPANAGHGDGGARGAGPGDAGDDEAGQDRRGGVGDFDESRGRPRRQPHQHGDDEAHHRDDDGAAHGGHGPVSHPCQHVAPERVGAQREGGAGLRELVRDDGVGVAPNPDGHHEGQQGGTADGDDAGSPPRVLHRRRCCESARPSGPPHEEASDRSGDDAGGQRQGEQQQDLGLEGRHVLGGGGVQELAPQPGDGEDLLHGDRAAGQGDDDERHLPGQWRQGPP